MSKTNIELHIVLLNGEELFISVLPQDTILKLKELIQEEIKEATSDIQSLTFKGKELKNEDTIQSYKDIKDGSQLVLTFYKSSKMYEAKQLFQKGYQLLFQGYEEKSSPIFLSSIQKGYFGGVGYYLLIHGVCEEFINKYIPELLSIDNNEDPDILFSQGICYYYYGDGVNRDYNKAFNCFNKVVTIDGNHAPALDMLSWCYWQGRGVSENQDKAGKLILQAAELNYLPAINEVIDGYYIGRYGLPRDQDKSKYWERKEKEIKSKELN